MRETNTEAMELQETRHRIKNHFGVLGSLLRARKEIASFGEAQRQLDFAIECVEILARIELALQHAEGCSFHTTLQHLADLWGSLSSARGVSIVLTEFDIAEVPHTAFVPLALIAHEAVTNSFKHAFAPNDEGHIRISVQQPQADLLEMHVADTGVGLGASGFVSGNGGSYVRLIARAINAQVRWLNNDGGGTLVHVALPLSSGNEP